ncbi:DUF6268 family outer membrane beta-barrel protein [uncultured Draconibacterium sp.]|uniref:DUF6268 family outer membrane beta-barrel protein n=1 Tax=uncultured Draconibacterium sp. TaxID=1573823 RepID=UPI002AA8D1FA|nr:DUF6268 family outer membrane beta-barrel protein [uncultured Draconibacterium sp.]
MKYILGLILVVIAVAGSAQDTISKEDWTPYFENNLPTRFLYLKMEGPFQYNISSTSDLEAIGDGSAEITGNRTVTARLKFPILNKQRVKLTGGIRYVNEQFYFEDIEPDGYPMYVGLNDRGLRRLGIDMKGMFHLYDNHSLVVQTSWSLAGDFHIHDNRYFSFGDLLKSSLAIGYATRKDLNTYYAFGAYFGYTFGDPAIYPVFNYSKRFANGIGLDLLLPQGFKAWKQINKRFYVVCDAEISGTSYTVRVDNTVLNETESIQLRQSTIDATVGIITQINKWVGFEAKFGYSNNINFNVTESNFKPGSTLPRPDTDYLIKSTVSGAPYASVALFLSVPRDLMDRCIE